MKSGKYRFIDHTADLGFEAFGADFESLLANSAMALFSLLTDMENVAPVTAHTFELSGTCEEILRQWLDGLLLEHNTEDLLFSRFEAEEAESGTIKATAWGEALDAERHTVHTEIKGITYHQFEVTRAQDGWVSRVIVDV